MVVHIYETIAHFFGGATELLQFCSTFDFLTMYCT